MSIPYPKVWEGICPTSTIYVRVSTRWRPGIPSMHLATYTLQKGVPIPAPPDIYGDRGIKVDLDAPDSKYEGSNV